MIDRADAGVRIDGRTLAVADTGEGQPVFLLHGAAPGASADGTWESLTPLLAREHRVVAPDFLGFGGSDKPDAEDYGIGLWTSQILGLADEMGIDRFSVVGNSLGGRVGLQLALDAPERIDNLILMSTRVTPSTSPIQALLRNYRPDRALMRELLHECFAHDSRTVTDELVERRYALSALPGAHEAIQSFFATLRAHRRSRSRSNSHRSINEHWFCTAGTTRSFPSRTASRWPN